MKVVIPITVFVAVTWLPELISAEQHALFVRKDAIRNGKRVSRQTSADQMVQNILQWLQGVYAKNSRKIRQGTFREYLPPTNTQKPRPFQPPGDHDGDFNYIGYPPSGSINPHPSFPFPDDHPPYNPQQPDIPGYPSHLPPDFHTMPGFPSHLPPGFPSHLPPSKPQKPPPTYIPPIGPPGYPGTVTPEKPLTYPTPPPTYPTHPPTEITYPPQTFPTKPPTKPTYPPQTFPTHPPVTQPTHTPPTYPTHPPQTVPTHPPTQPTHFPPTIPTHPPQTYPTQPPTYPPQTFPTHPPQTYPTHPPQTLPTHPPTEPTHPPQTFPTHPPQTFPTHPPQTFPTHPPQTLPTHPPTEPTHPPQTFPTHPPQTFPTHPPQTLPTHPPTEPTHPPQTFPTHPPQTFPTHPPQTFPTHPPQTLPTHPPPEPTHPPQTFPTHPPTHPTHPPEFTIHTEPPRPFHPVTEPVEVESSYPAATKPSVVFTSPEIHTTYPPRPFTNIPDRHTTVPGDNVPSDTQDDEDLKHPPHIHSIDVQCAKDMMTINIEFNRPFNGIIYSKGYYHQPDCRYVHEHSNRIKYTFTVSLNSCGTEFVNGFHTQGKSYLENVLVLQNEPGIQEVWDTIRAVRCLWEGNLNKTLSVALSVGMLNQEIVSFSGDTAMAKLDIKLGRGPFAPNAHGLVKIGEIMTLVVSVTGDPGFDVQVKDCQAKDSSGNNVVHLTDDEGCVLKPKLLGAFQKTRHTGDTGASIIAYAYFNAFKFPDVMDLMIECNVELCKTDCEVCPNPQKIDPSRRRRRKRDINSIGEPVTVGKMLRVILPEDISDIEKLNLTNKNEICLSTESFAISSILLISLLTASSLLSAYLWLRNKRLIQKF